MTLFNFIKFNMFQNIVYKYFEDNSPRELMYTRRFLFAKIVRSSSSSYSSSSSSSSVF